MHCNHVSFNEVLMHISGLIVHFASFESINACMFLLFSVHESSGSTYNSGTDCDIEVLFVAGVAPCAPPALFTEHPKK